MISSISRMAYCLLHAIEQKEGARAQAIAQEHVQVAKLNLDYALERPELAERVMPAIRLVSSVHKETTRRGAK